MNDQRDEALRLAKEAGLDKQLTHMQIGVIARLIALARASAAPQEPEPDPSDELAWYKWAHKELGRRNATLKAENAEWKRIADQAHAGLAENKGAVHWKERAKAAQSQAAALAELLEEIKGALWAKYYADEIKKIDAALAAWKGEMR
jgi:hypothetical protein